MKRNSESERGVRDFAVTENKKKTCNGEARYECPCSMIVKMWS